MTTLILSIDLPNPSHREDVQRDILRTVRAAGATATPVADGTMGGSLFEIVPQILTMAEDVEFVTLMVGTIKSIVDCLYTYEERRRQNDQGMADQQTSPTVAVEQKQGQVPQYVLVLLVEQNGRRVQLTTRMSPQEQESLLRELILDNTPVNAKVETKTME